MTTCIAAVAEDRLGVTLAHDLLDRVVIEEGPSWMADLWSEPSLLPSARAWQGLEGREPFARWTHLADPAPERRRVLHGLGLSGWSLQAYRAVQLAARLDPLPDVLVLCVDTQGNASLHTKLVRGIEHAGAVPFAVLLAVAHQESEAWVVCGFVPADQAEARRLRDYRQRHGFDPTTEAHRLTPNRPTDPHDAKRCCDELLQGDSLSPRASACWQRVPLAVLRERGNRTGLTRYLDAVADWLGRHHPGHSG